MKRLVIGAGGAATAVLAVVVAPLALVPGIGVRYATQPGDLFPSGAAVATIPPAYLALYRAAAATCPGLSWTVLAGIGEVETDHGRAAAPGVATGANSAGAAGPMQMEPASFAAYDHPVAADRAVTPAAGARPADPHDPTDAVYAAARMLCAGAAPVDLRGALFSYNHAGWYVDEVLAWAARYGAVAAGAAGPQALLAVQWALSAVGTPYVWGGDTAAGGFDCSGLVQWAYAQSGITLPRVAQAQHDALSPVSAGTTPAAGDLVFFGADAAHVDHVGIYLGDGKMVDAPHTGAQVRVEGVAGFVPGLVGFASPVPPAPGSG